MAQNFSELANFIWGVADLLRGDYRQSDYSAGIVIDTQDGQNNIAEQLLKDERIFGVMQRMLAKMVWQQFQQGGSQRGQ